MLKNYSLLPKVTLLILSTYHTRNIYGSVQLLYV